MALTHRKVTGLSGNEIFCLSKQGLAPGQLCVGNSVVAIGVLQGLGAGVSILAGGEVEAVTDLVSEGRAKAYERMMAEARSAGGVGVTGVAFDVVSHGGNLEFITVGSTVHVPDGDDSTHYSTSADAQELYCQQDAGFKPIRFVFGNVAYSIGLGNAFTGVFRKLARGEVPQYTQIFDHTRKLALERIREAASLSGANAVIGIRTSIIPLMGTQEMMMVGTASRHPLLATLPNLPVTSDMTNEEMWNMANIAYVPLGLVMGVSVYSLGLGAGILAWLKSLIGGEVKGLTDLLYEAREKALARIHADAELLHADEVIGVKTRVYDLGSGLVEFLAIGTAVKKMPGMGTSSPLLLPQAIIKDVDTFIDSTRSTDMGAGQKSSAPTTQGGPVGIVVFVIFAIFFLLNFFH